VICADKAAVIQKPAQPRVTKRVARVASEFNEAKAFIGVEPFNDGVDVGSGAGSGSS
jgi:hypothetical protein